MPSTAKIWRLSGPGNAEVNQIGKRFRTRGGWGAQFCPQVTDNKPASKGTNQMSSVTDDCDKKTTEYGKRNWSGEARKAA